MVFKRKITDFEQKIMVNMPKLIYCKRNFFGLSENRLYLSKTTHFRLKLSAKGMDPYQH